VGNGEWEGLAYKIRLGKITPLLSTSFKIKARIKKPYLSLVSNAGEKRERIVGPCVSFVS